ncbi:IS1595 family transposase, partial [Photobacterium sp. ZSDE20]|nr:IS1595 family transposase [Photobacterium sp. ZSDE20]
INKKHLPRYLAEFCFKFNRRFNMGKMLEQLIYSGIQTAPMPQRLLKLTEARW